MIKFIDRKTGDLLYEAFYDSGIINGSKSDYYSKGTMKSTGNYEKGKLNGYISFFDTVGNVSERQYFYYDLMVGPRIKYRNGLPESYEFYSLENVLLFSLNYDSAIGKKITDLQENFYFYNTRTYFQMSSENPLVDSFEYFLYTFKPPKYDFTYDLVEIDSSFNIKSVIRNLKNVKAWNIFSYNKHEFNDGYGAIRLVIYDSVNNKRSTMLKRLSS